MKNAILVLTIAFVGLISCNKNKCVTCTNDTESLEICDDSNLTYSDPNGYPIDDFDDLVQSLENIGYDCQ